VTERNIELLRRFTEVYNGRDVEALIAYCDPSIEFHSAFAAIGGVVYRGHDGLRRWQLDYEDAWADGIRVEPEAYFDLGGGQTLVFHIMRGRGRHSGAEVAMPIAAALRWRDGLVIHWKVYTHREDALSDLGVSREELEPIEP
jgi:ketosteroid isomerase-like protein